MNKYKYFSLFIFSVISLSILVSWNSLIPSSLAASASAPLRGVIGGIDCFGDPGHAPFGQVVMSRAGNILTVEINVVNGLPNTGFDVELWEADPDCNDDNLAKTGNSLTTDASGNGTATFSVTLPKPSLGSSTLGDGAGTEQVVITLNNQAIISGDTYVMSATPLPIAEEEEGNEAPVVNAGEDKTGNTSGTVTLDGTVTDDGKPTNTLTTSWSVVPPGPGEEAVIFGNASSVDTTVIFEKPGTYILRLTASDGEKESFDEITITIENKYIPIEIVFKAFIPYNYLLAPDLGLSFPQSTPIFSSLLFATFTPVYAGDDRNFDYSSMKFRTYQKFDMKLANGRVPQFGAPVQLTGTTKAYSITALANGRIDENDKPAATGKASTDDMKVTYTSTGQNDGSAIVTLNGSSPNPLIAGSPKIDWCYNIVLIPHDDGTVSYTVTGGNDDFPAYELYLNKKPVVQFRPSRPDPLLLLGGCTDSRVSTSGMTQ